MDFFETCHSGSSLDCIESDVSLLYLQTPYFFKKSFTSMPNIIYHLSLYRPSVLFPLGFKPKLLYGFTFLIFSMRVNDLAHLKLLDFIIDILFYEEYTLRKCFKLSTIGKKRDFLEEILLLKMEHNSFFSSRMSVISK